MNKLPYLIDELYKTNDKIKLILCCMLLEASYDKIEFITNLEKYPLSKAKFEALSNDWKKQSKELVEFMYNY